MSFTYTDILSLLGDERLQYLGYELFEELPFWGGLNFAQKSEANFSYNVQTGNPTTAAMDPDTGTYSDTDMSVAVRKVFMRKYGTQVAVDAYASSGLAANLRAAYRSFASKVSRDIHLGNSITVTIPGACSSKGVDGLVLSAQWDPSSDSCYLKYTDGTGWQLSTDNSTWGAAVDIASGTDDKSRFPIYSENAQKWGWLTVDASDCFGLGNLASTEVTIAVSSEMTGLLQLVDPARVIWADGSAIDVADAASHSAALGLTLFKRLLDQCAGLDKKQSAFLISKESYISLISALNSAAVVSLAEWKGLAFDESVMSVLGVPVFATDYLTATHTVGGSSMQEVYLAEFSPEGYQLAYRPGLAYSIGLPGGGAGFAADQFAGSSVVLPFRVQPIAEGSTTSLLRYRVDGMLSPMCLSLQKMAAAFGISN